MKTLAKWTLRLLVIVVALIIVVPIAATFLVDQDDIKQSIDDKVFEKTGRHLQIVGDIGWRPGLNFNVYAEGIRYQNADWASPESAFTAGRLSARVSLAALLDGKVRIDRVQLDDAVLWIEARDGKVNLANPGTGPATGPKPVELPDWLEIGQIQITGSKIVNVLKSRDFEIGLDQVKITNTDPAEPLQLIAEGRLQEAELALQGSLGSLQSLMARSSSDADLVASFGENDQLTATGTVDDVLAWKGVDVVLEGTLRSLRYLDSLFPFSPPAIENIALTARLIQPGKAKTMQLESIDGGFAYAGIDSEIEGEIGNLVKLRQMQLEVSAEGEVDKDLLPDRVAGVLAPGVSLKAELAGDLKAPALNIVDGEVKLDGATLQASGEIDNLRGDWTQPIPLTLSVDDASAIADKLDIKLPDLGGIAGTADLVSAGGDFSLNNIKLNNQSDLSSIAVNGAINNFGQDQSGQLAIDAEVTSGFIASAGYALPLKVDTLTANAQVHLAGQNIELVLDNAETTVPGASISASGGIPDLKNPTTLSIDLKGTVNQLAMLGKEFGIELPEVSPIGVSATLAGEEGSWNLESINLNTDNDGLKAVANGTISNLGPDLNASLAVNGTLTTNRVMQLAPAAATTLESIQNEMTPIGFSTEVTAESAKKWALSNIETESNWLGAKLAVVGDISAFAPLAGELDVSLRGATHSQTALLKAHAIPPLDNVDIALKLPLPLAENGIRDIRGRVEAQSARLEFDGDISKLSPLEGRGFQLSLVADDINALAAGDEMFQPGTAIDAGLDIDFHPGEISARGSVKVGNSDVTGSASWQSPGDARPKLEANLKSTLLDLVSLLPEPDKAAKDSPPPSKTNARMIADTGLIPPWSDKLDADVELDIRSLKSRVVSLNALAGTVTLEDGHLVSSVSGVNGSGEVSAEISLKKGAHNSISVTLDNFPVDAINAVSASQFLTGGGVDIALDIDGKGNSVVELLEKGSGNLDIDLYDSRMQRSALNLVGGDLLTNITSAINPFAERHERVGVECAVIHFDIRDSKISTQNGIAMKTDRVTLLGSGEITFPEESLTMAIAPKARKGLGVSASSIAKMVRIGGTLSNPSIESDAKGFLQSGAAIGAALASGGLSLFAQGLYDRLKANSDVCAIARGDYEEADQQQQQEQPDVTQATRK